MNKKLMKVLIVLTALIIWRYNMAIPTTKELKVLQGLVELVREKTNYNIGDEEAMKLVYETLVYRKLKSSDSSDMLEKGTDFGAGFS